jgi:hypothetical protein
LLILNEKNQFLHLVCAIVFLLFDLDFGFVSEVRSWFPLDLSLRWHHFWWISPCASLVQSAASALGQGMPFAAESLLGVKGTAYFPFHRTNLVLFSCSKAVCVG